MEIADRHGLRVVEDCAQAFGARVGDHPVGSFGDAGCFSFFPTKNLGGYGDGGMVATDSQSIRDHVLSLRNHGSHRRYHHDEVGYNSRLDEIQAAALRVKLRHLETLNEQRRRIAGIYDRDLADLDLHLPPQPAGRHHVYGQYTVRVAQRDRVREALQEWGVATAIYYPIPLHQQKVCRDSHGEVSLPVCEQVAGECFSLPMFPGMSEAQAEEVVRAVRAVLNGPAAA